MTTRTASKRISLNKLSKEETTAAMDPNVWGTLPRELLLKVYTSMKIQEFYEQRLVCKEWNREACSRRYSTDSIPRPYFVTTHHNENNPHVGIIAYNASAGTWMFRFLTTHYRSFQAVVAFHCSLPVGAILEPFAADGVLFGKGCFHCSHMSQCFHSPDRYFVFDVQAGRSILDSITFGSSAGKEGTVVGMAVDKSKKPHGVKLIVGTPGASTLILDSETATWKTYPSHMIRNREPRGGPFSPKACVTCDGKMYIWTDIYEIQVYSLEQDLWSTLDPPPRRLNYNSCRGLGHWQKEIYAVTLTDRWLLPTVWKLGGSLAWEEFEHMPACVWDYLQKPLANLVPKKVMRILIVSQSCSEFLLMHIIPAHGRGPKTKLRRHVLFSLATKRWEPVEVPKSKMRSTTKGWIL